MDVAIFSILLRHLSQHTHDIVFAIILAALVYFQWHNVRYSRRSAESCARTDEKLSNTIPSVSKRIIDVVKNSASVNRELGTILNDLEADRAYVYMLHNAGYNFIGQPFAKLTNTNEVVRNGFAPNIAQMKDIPVGVMSSFLSVLFEHKEIKCYDINNYKEHDWTAYSYLHNLGIKSTYTIAIFAPQDIHTISDGSGRSSLSAIPIGFVGIDYMRNVRALTNEEFKTFHARVMIIKGLLLERSDHEIKKIRENYALNGVTDKRIKQ